MYTATGLNYKEQCLREYAQLVKRLAHQMMTKLPYSVQIDDIIQAGMMGLYDALWWYDVMMHGLGGLWVGLFFLAWHKSTPFLPSDTLRQVIRLLGLVLFVGLMWEMFEAGFDYTIGPQIGFSPLWGDPRQGALFDSAEDLVLDMAGGILAYMIIKKHVFVGA